MINPTPYVLMDGQPIQGDLSYPVDWAGVVIADLSIPWGRDNVIEHDAPGNATVKILAKERFVELTKSPQGRAITIGYRHLSLDRVIFRGYVEDATLTFDRRVDGDNWFFVTLEISSNLTRLERQKILDGTRPVESAASRKQWVEQYATSQLQRVIDGVGGVNDSSELLFAPKDYAGAGLYESINEIHESMGERSIYDPATNRVEADGFLGPGDSALRLIWSDRGTVIVSPRASGRGMIPAQEIDMGELKYDQLQGSRWYSITHPRRSQASDGTWSESTPSQGGVIPARTTRRDLTNISQTTMAQWLYSPSTGDDSSSFDKSQALIHRFIGLATEFVHPPITRRFPDGWSDTTTMMEDLTTAAVRQPLWLANSVFNGLAGAPVVHRSIGGTVRFEDGTWEITQVLSPMPIDASVTPFALRDINPSSGGTFAVATNRATNPAFRTAAGSVVVPSPLRVGTYNLRKASIAEDKPERDWSVRKPVAAATIIKQNVAIVALQEISYVNDYARSQAMQTVDEINLQAGTPDRWQWTEKKGASSNSIIWDSSKVEKISDNGTLIVNSPSIGRALLWAIFRDKSTGQKFIFVSSHWENNGEDAARGEAMRQQSARMTADLLTQLRLEHGLPIILGADFNTSATTTGSPLAYLASKGFATAKTLVTAPVNAQWRSATEFDHTMTGKDNGWWIDGIAVSSGVTVSSHGMYMDFVSGTTPPLKVPMGSDHHMLWAEVKLTGKGVAEMGGTAAMVAGSSAGVYQSEFNGQPVLTVDASGVTADSAAAYLAGYGAGSTAKLGMTPGETYTASVDMIITKVLPGAGSSWARQIVVATNTGSNNIGRSASAPNTIGTHRLSVTFTAPTVDGDRTTIRLMHGHIGGISQWRNFLLTDSVGEIVYYDGSTRRQNMAANPSFEKDTATMSGGSGVTFALASGDTVSGTYAAKISGLVGVNRFAGPSIEVPVGTTQVTASMAIKAQAGAKGFRLRIGYRDTVGTGTYIYHPQRAAFTAAGWTRAAITETIPATTKEIRFLVYPDNDDAAPITYLMDAITVESGATDGTYFETTGPATGWDGRIHQWTGAADKSTSTRTTPNNDGYAFELSEFDDSLTLAELSLADKGL